ncbi:hypothetical protein J2S43_001744 [Catenuloplanes nepalensis]|uniref:Sel1 repeat family protein n=1 Tax=Catenuloplanes nepalensis TaxID=587533 RepID=A0ABT9MPA3_9ACTN|nr:hypothetical protein [Catenuloplanes nepalensis]MDP9793232.1 hypothetical protein [Catenuloplanes nepalensis]
MNYPWTAWADAAADDDRFGLMLTLLDAVPAEEQDRDLTVRRAALLLHDGRAGEAIAALRGVGVAELPDGPETTFGHLVLAAARAAGGDRPAYRWLMVWAGRIDGEVSVCYLVAVAATGVGDRETADLAWHTLATRYGKVTPLTVARYAAAKVAKRADGDPALAVALAAMELHHLGVPVDRDPGPALEAARDLRARGDHEGARLLLHAVRRRLPAVPALDAALAELTPAGAMRRHRITVVAMWSLVPLLVLPVVWTVHVPAPAAGLVVLAARLAWERWVPIPGLSRADSAVWRAFRAVGYDPFTDPTAPPPKDQKGYYGLAGLLGLIFFGIPLSLAVERLVPDGAMRTGLYLFVCAGVAALGYLGARRAHHWLRARAHARRREQERHARLAEARRCHCWRMQGCSGEFADEYLRHHLRAEPFDDAPPALRGKAWLGRCAATDTVWLAVPGSRGLLLRGAVAPQPKDRPESVGMYL